MAAAVESEDFLLEDFKQVTTYVLAAFYTNGVIMSLLPIFMYYKMQWIDSYVTPILILTTPPCTYLMKIAYSNIKLKFKHKIVLKREQRDVRKKFFRKLNKRDRKEQILETNEIDDFEATLGSLFYNNCLYLAVVIFLNFALLHSLVPLLSLFLSTVGTAGLVALLSTSL